MSSALQRYWCSTAGSHPKRRSLRQRSSRLAGSQSSTGPPRGSAGRLMPVYKRHEGGTPAAESRWKERDRSADSRRGDRSVLRGARFATVEGRLRCSPTCGIPSAAPNSRWRAFLGLRSSLSTVRCVAALGRQSRGTERSSMHWSSYRGRGASKCDPLQRYVQRGRPTLTSPIRRTAGETGHCIACELATLPLGCKATVERRTPALPERSRFPVAR